MSDENNVFADERDDSLAANWMTPPTPPSADDGESLAARGPSLDTPHDEAFRDGWQVDLAPAEPSAPADEGITEGLRELGGVVEEMHARALERRHERLDDVHEELYDRVTAAYDAGHDPVELAEAVRRALPPEYHAAFVGQWDADEQEYDEAEPLDARTYASLVVQQQQAAAEAAEAERNAAFVAETQATLLAAFDRLRKQTPDLARHTGVMGDLLAANPEAAVASATSPQDARVLLEGTYQSAREIARAERAAAISMDFEADAAVWNEFLPHPATQIPKRSFQDHLAERLDVGNINLRETAAQRKQRLDAEMAHNPVAAGFADMDNLNLNTPEYQRHMALRARRKGRR